MSQWSTNTKAAAIPQRKSMAPVAALSSVLAILTCAALVAGGLGAMFGSAPSFLGNRKASAVVEPAMSAPTPQTLAVPAGYRWIANSNVSYDFKTTLRMKFAESNSAKPKDQPPLIDLRIDGKYHLRVLDVGTNEVRLVALLEPTVVSNEDQTIAEALPILQGTVCLVSLGLDGELHDLRFPQGTNPENIQLLRAVFGWTFVIQGGARQWSRDERDETGIIVADYRVEPDGESIIKTRRVPPVRDTGIAALIRRSSFKGIPGQVWLRSLHGSEYQELVSESSVFAAATLSVDLEAIEAQIPEALLHVDAASFTLLHSPVIDELADFRQVPFSAAMHRLAECSTGPGRELSDYSEAGRYFENWLRANPGQAVQVVEALQKSLPDGQTAFLTRALADVAPLEAARLLAHSHDYPADVVYQQLASLSTSPHSKDMPSSIGGAIAQVFNSDVTQTRERESAILALGTFAEAHPEWLQPLWSTIAPDLVANGDTATLSIGLHALANSRHAIPDATHAAVSVGLRHSQPEVRLASINYLSAIPPSPEATAALQQTLSGDPNEAVRIAAARALSEFGQAKPQPAAGTAGFDN